VIELVAKTDQPTLAVTGPRRFPQARTNTRWTNSLAVPILKDNRTVGVVYATRNSTEPFAAEDLHWLTAYASTAGPVFDHTRDHEAPHKQLRKDPGRPANA
jgi:dolichol-phosphate mannosyltransferase